MAESKENPVLFSRDGALVTLTLNRPQAMNAMNFALISELWRRAKEIEADPGVRVVIITGTGNRSFSAGFDIKETRSFTLEQRFERADLCQRLYGVMESLPAPIIAAVNGHCLGGGFETVMHCDIAIAAEHATFGLPQIIRGGFAAGGGTVRLPRLIPMGTAKRILYTGKSINAQEALRAGLVEQVVPAQQLLDAARQMAEDMLAVSPIGLAGCKRVVNLTRELDIPTAQAINWAIRIPIEATQDRTEALDAFVEKRQPRFRGE